MSKQFDNSSFDTLLKESLQDLQIPAPSEVWSNLEAELGFDQVLQESFQQFEVPAPQGVLEAVQSQVSGSLVNGGLSFAGKWIVTGMIGVTVVTTAYFIAERNELPEQKVETSEVTMPQSGDKGANDAYQIVEQNKEISPESNQVEGSESKPNQVVRDEASSNGPAQSPETGDGLDAPMSINLPKENTLFSNNASLPTGTNQPDIFPAVSFLADDTSLCIGQEYRIHLKHANELAYEVHLNGIKKQWRREGEAFVFTPERSGKYQLEIGTQAKELKWLRRQVIVVEDKPVARINILDKGEGTYEFECSNEGRSEWFIDGNKLKANAIQFYDPIPTDHQAMLVKTNSTGCKDTAHLEFRNNVIFEISELVMPNTFTPNGDGKNDEYRVLIKGTTHFRMIIYNSNYQIVFETNDPEGSWNGIDKFKGNVIESGTYTCLIEYAIAGGELKSKTELIHLIAE